MIEAAISCGRDVLFRAGLTASIEAGIFLAVVIAVVAALCLHLRRLNHKLRNTTSQLDATLSSVSHGLCMFDADKRVIVVNERYAALYGLPPHLCRPGTPLDDILAYRVAVGNAPLDPQGYPQFHATLARSQNTISFECELQDGRVIRISRQPAGDGGYIASHEDVTAQKHAKAHLAYLTRHDALTKLPNHALFRQELELSLDRTGRGDKIAVMSLDIDQFEVVNQSFGHSVGDALLVAVANRLRSCLRENDMVARLGGDKFGIVEVAVDHPYSATVLAQRIIAAFGMPFDIEGHQIIVGISIGIAIAPHNGSNSEDMLNASELALDLVKKEGGGAFRFFEPAIAAEAKPRRHLELDLRKAIFNNEFEIHYQPLVTVAAHKISGFEALLRWKHPQRGDVPPADFIPVAEEIGLIGEIGAWVLKQACMDAATWPGEMRLSVNISPVQFSRPTLFLDVVSALNSSGLHPSRLELEITETAMMQDTKATLGILQKLRALGVRISMDDFGAGCSSLNHLRRFQFDKIKIDRTLVRDLATDADALAIVGFGASLGMATTAAGVETPAQLEYLKAGGCTEVQGWLFSPAKPASEISSLFEGPFPLRAA